ncbi:MAG: hypothetical protein IBJ10_09940 [Phycisphaerales bacterium]|nr:hypothetical protein [Phycisphaerales bacterium]
MKRVRRVARSAAARASLREALGLLGPALTAGFVVAGLLVAADRLLALGLSVWALTAAPALIAAGAAVVVAVSRRPDEAGAAERVDRALGLRDRLSSAIELHDIEGDEENGFVRWAVEDAEQAAQKASVARAIPLRLDGWWAVWPALGAAVVFAAVMAPSMDLLGRGEAKQRRLVEATQRSETAAEIAEAAERAREAIEEAARGASDEQLRALEELEKQLTEGLMDPDEARAKAAASLEEMASRAEAEAERLERELSALAEHFAALDPAQQDSPLGRELAQALRDGDYARAADLLEELSRSTQGAMDDAARERTAEDLERLARQIEAAGEGAPMQQQSARQKLIEDLKNQGLSQADAEAIASMSDEQAIREALEDRGVSPEAAQRLAEQIAQANQRREASEAARERAREMSESLREAAGECRNPGQSGSPKEGGQSQQGQKQQGQQDQPKGAERASEAMRQAQGQCESAGECRGGAQSMREGAKGLMEGSSDSAKEQMQRWANQQSRERSSSGESQGRQGSGIGQGPGEATQRPDGSPFREETVDARRGSAEGGHVAAEWLDPSGAATPGVDRAPTAERVREAAQSAERALEEQSVSPRYSRVVREFFRRRLESAEPAPAPAPVPAEDAVRDGEGGKSPD